MKLILTGVLALLVLGMAGTARADWDVEKLAKISKLKNENKAFREFLGEYSEGQVFSFNNAKNGWTYVVDVRAQLCFVQSTLVQVPCKSLKKGYPLIAPLITWDD